MLEGNIACSVSRGFFYNELRDMAKLPAKPRGRSPARAIHCVIMATSEALKFLDER